MLNSLFNLEISLDWSWVYNLGHQPIHIIIWHFFINGGWILFVVALLYGAYINFVYWRQSKFAAKQSYIYLAIDVPKANIQTPKAMENIFTALAGAHMPLDWHEKVFKGEYQLGFSAEIVSIDGFIQFIFRTPVHWRNLVEAAVYSQYPEAEITEVNDYMTDINTTFPSDEYNLWGADLVPTNKDYYPIKVYKEFHDLDDKESSFKDPLAALLEVMNAVGPGEQIWFQILFSPADIGWQEAGMKEINKRLGIAEKYKETALDKIIESPIKAMQFVNEHALGLGGVESDDKREEKNMMFITPHEKREIESILNKIDKICFNVKVRFGYYGKREVFKKGLGVSGVMGAIKQFGSTALNAFKPGSNKTQAKLWLKKYRMSQAQNAFLSDYKSRNGETCDGKSLMSVEELATLFHFPMLEVKTPLMKRTESRRANAPIGLPTNEEGHKGTIGLPVADEENALPDKAEGLDYDNDYFEARFAVDKTGESDKKRKDKVIEKLKKEGKLPDENKSTSSEENQGPEIEPPVAMPSVEVTEDETPDPNGPNNLPFV
jgi:hypothetical protein